MKLIMLIIFTAMVGIGCSSDSTSPNQSSTASFAFQPISSEFFSDTTVMVEVHQRYRTFELQGLSDRNVQG